MKVDWNRIINENHKPSRVSRRLAKMLGGGADQPPDEEVDYTVRYREPGITDYTADDWKAAVLTGIDTLANAYDPIGNLPLIIMGAADSEAERLAAEKAQRELVQRNSDFRRKAVGQYTAYLDEQQRERVRKSKILDPATRARAVKQQEENQKIVAENEAYGAMLRNEQQRKDEADRKIARMRATTAQNAATLQAAKQGATTLMGELTRIKAANAATAAAKAQNLRSLQALATQRGAVAAAEAVQQKAIQANSAQQAALQNEEMARLHAEAMAKQAQLSQVSTTARVVRAPQVKIGGSKASGYVQKLLAMYNDGLEGFDINKMKWASDHLKALGIMMEEPPADFPMGRTGLKKYSEVDIEPKMNTPTTPTTPAPKASQPKTKKADAAEKMISKLDNKLTALEDKLKHRRFSGVGTGRTAAANRDYKIIKEKIKELEKQLEKQIDELEAAQKEVTPAPQASQPKPKKKCFYCDKYFVNPSIHIVSSHKDQVWKDMADPTKPLPEGFKHHKDMK